MMISFSTALVLLATVSVGFGGWMIVAWFARTSQSGAARKNQRWLSGCFLVLCGIGLLMLAAEGTFSSDNTFAKVVFWIPVVAIGELSVVLVWIRYWPKLIQWGIERPTLNPPAPVMLASFIGGLLLAGVVALAVVVAPRLS